MSLHGLIFDLDGTLVDSGLDFDAIRADLGLQPGQLILETVEDLPPGAEKDRCLEILHDHEVRGAERATLMPGVAKFLALLKDRGIKTGILTRNSLDSTNLTLQRLGLRFDPIVTRDCAAPKPDPAGLLSICRQWGCNPDETAYVGDYLFDIQAGQNAGMPTVLYVPGELPDFAHRADHLLHHFDEAESLLDLLA